MHANVCQDFHALKPRLNFLSPLTPALQKDNFLSNEFKILQLEECFMQLLVAEDLENKDMAQKCGNPVRVFC